MNVCCVYPPVVTGFMATDMDGVWSNVHGREGKDGKSGETMIG